MKCNEISVDGKEMEISSLASIQAGQQQSSARLASRPVRSLVR